MVMRISKRPLKKFQQLKKLLPIGKPMTVQRSSTPYIEKMGWQQTTSFFRREWHGYYRTRFGSYKGRITASTPPQFYIYKPPKGLKERHSHKACFTALKDGWYSVHFNTIPRDLDSGVIKLERILCEAYLLTDKTA